MIGDEAKVDEQIVEEFFKHLLTGPEPTLPSTVEHAVQGGRRTLRRRNAAGATLVSLVVAAALASSALLGPHSQTVAPPGGTPSSTAVPSVTPTMPAMRNTTSPSAVASPARVASPAGPVPSSVARTAIPTASSLTPASN